jgi:hypothetical protein
MKSAIPSLSVRARFDQLPYFADFGKIAAAHDTSR